VNIQRAMIALAAAAPASLSATCKQSAWFILRVFLQHHLQRLFAWFVILESLPVVVTSPFGEFGNDHRLKSIINTGYIWHTAAYGTVLAFAFFFASLHIYISFSVHKYCMFLLSKIALQFNLLFACMM
jgi:hypothetical protein